LGRLCPEALQEAEVRVVLDVAVRDGSKTPQYAVTLSAKIAEAKHSGSARTKNFMPHQRMLANGSGAIDLSVLRVPG
jgi:hypothetical protein